MNRRLLLIFACALLPSTSLGAQIAQPGEASTHGRDEGSRSDRDERKSRKKSALAGAGFGIGTGTAFDFHSDAERVTQQDFCIGACAPLRASSRVMHASSTAAHVDATSSSSVSTVAKHGGVLALLESLGNVSDHAIDALTSAPGHATAAEHDVPSSANVAAHRASAATGKAASSAAVIVHHPEFDAAMHGCVLGCQPTNSANIISPTPGSEAGMFGGVSAVGTVALAGGDLNTIVNPEPSTVVLMLSGLAAMAAIARRKRSVG